MNKVNCDNTRRFRTRSRTSCLKVIEVQDCFGVKKMECSTYEEISNGMMSMLFKGDRVQITVGVSKMDCDM